MIDMKKLIIGILLFTSLMGCKKTDGCWECELSGTYNGVNYDGQTQTICNESDQAPTPKDANGNDIGGRCTKK